MEGGVEVMALPTFVKSEGEALRNSPHPPKDEDSSKPILYRLVKVAEDGSVQLATDDDLNQLQVLLRESSLFVSSDDDDAQDSQNMHDYSHVDEESLKEEQDGEEIRVQEDGADKIGCYAWPGVKDREGERARLLIRMKVLDALLHHIELRDRELALDRSRVGWPRRTQGRTRPSKPRTLATAKDGAPNWIGADKRSPSAGVPSVVIMGDEGDKHGRQSIANYVVPVRSRTAKRRGHRGFQLHSSSPVVTGLDSNTLLCSKNATAQGVPGSTWREPSGLSVSESLKRQRRPNPRYFTDGVLVGFDGECEEGKDHIPSRKVELEGDIVGKRGPIHSCPFGGVSQYSPGVSTEPVNLPELAEHPGILSGMLASSEGGGKSHLKRKAEELDTSEKQCRHEEVALDPETDLKTNSPKEAPAEAVVGVVKSSRCASRTTSGGLRRKHHRPWTLREVDTLVEGVAQCGGGKWADIKKLAFASIGYRTAVDLKDKWRNLLRASRIMGNQPPRMPGSGGSKKHQMAASIPAPVLARVRELASLQAETSNSSGGSPNHASRVRTSVRHLPFDPESSK